MSSHLAHNRPGKKGDLTSGPVAGHLVRMTIPMIWGIFAIISFQLVDIFYISLLGTQALAALTFTFPVTFTVFSLILGMSIATSSVLSRQIGRGNWARVRRLTTHALLISFITSLILALLGIFLMGPVFRAMGADQNLMPMINDYMIIWFAGSVFINVPIVGNAAQRAAGDTFLPALIMTITAVVNAILDPLLIFGLLGFPALGIKGAAIATVFANACALIAGLYVIDRKLAMLTRSRKHLRLFGDSAKRFLFIALPAGLTSTIQPITNAIIISLLASFGHAAVAAFGIVTRIEAFAFVIIMGLAVGMAPIVGQNWGAQKFERVKETLKKAFFFAVLWSLFVAAVLMVFAKPIASLFSKEADVISVAALYFWIIPATYALGNLVHGWGSAFNAIGMPQRSFIMIFVRLVLLNIPLAFIGAHLYGITGIFGSIAVTNIAAGIVFHLWNRKTIEKLTALPSS